MRWIPPGGPTINKIVQVCGGVNQVDPPTKFLASLHGEGGKGVGAFANSR